jgi:chromosomal replication initiation ATPase DnaA
MLNTKQNTELNQVLNFTPYGQLTEREKIIYSVAARNGYNLGLKHKKQLDRVEALSFNKEVVKVKYINKNFSSKISESSKIIADDIVSKSIDMYDVSLEDFISIKRLHPIVQARSVAINLIKEVLNLSLNNVSMFIGKRDHTTMIHHIRMKHNKEHLWQEGKRIWEDYDKIKYSL